VPFKIEIFDSLTVYGDGTAQERVPMLEQTDNCALETDVVPRLEPSWRHQHLSGKEDGEEDGEV